MSKLMQKLLASSTTKNASILSKSELFLNKDIITTDIPIINVAFSGELDGGITGGNSILLAGPSRVFKSNLALVCVRAYFNKYPDAVCILYDSEGGMNPEFLATQGIDSSRILHVPIEHLEMLKFDIMKQLKEINRGDKVIFVIDSIGNTGSLKEIQDALDEKSVAEMQRARTIKGLMRMVTPSLLSKDVPCITICHTYDDMANPMAHKQIISGGSGLLYSSSVAFIIGKSQEKDSDGDLAGWKFTLNVEKSRYVREKSKLPFRVLYETGIQKYSGLLDLALEAGTVIKPSNGWYSRVDADGVVEPKKWRAKDTDTEEFWGEMLKSTKFKSWVKATYSLYDAPKQQDTIESEAIDDLED